MNKKPGKRSRKGLDTKDRRIIYLLAQNAFTPDIELARAVGLVPSAVQRRRERLAKMGYLNYDGVSMVDLDKLLPAQAFVTVTVVGQSGEGDHDLMDDVATDLWSIPGVLEILLMPSPFGYYIHVAAPDLETLSKTVIAQIKTVPGVRKEDVAIVTERIFPEQRGSSRTETTERLFNRLVWPDFLDE